MSTRDSNQTLSVYFSTDFSASEGVAHGDGLTIADDLVMDDVYQLRDFAERRKLSLHFQTERDLSEVAEGSALGTAGYLVVIDCCVKIMGTSDVTQEVLVLVEVEDDTIAEISLLPLAELKPKSDYRLFGFDRHIAAKRFAKVACVSFTKGTHITVASGKQVPIEELRAGDKVLTRDDGPQEVRWVRRKTLRATGNFKPVVIKEGALNNTNDLIVSPDNRLFIYQRQEKLRTGRAQVLVKARQLFHGNMVVQQPGG